MDDVKQKAAEVLTTALTKARVSGVSAELAAEAVEKIAIFVTDQVAALGYREALAAGATRAAKITDEDKAEEAARNRK